MSPCLLWFQCLCCSRLTACSARGIHRRIGQQKEGRQCAGERGNWEQVGELLQLLFLLWYDKLRSAQTFPSTSRPQQISQHFYEEPCAERLMSHKSYHYHTDLFNNSCHYSLWWQHDINSASIVRKKNTFHTFLTLKRIFLSVSNTSLQDLSAFICTFKTLVHFLGNDYFYMKSIFALHCFDIMYITHLSPYGWLFCK